MAGCGGCGARQAAMRNAVTKFRWTSTDGMETKDYDEEILAKTKVRRAGGTYIPVDLSQ